MISIMVIICSFVACSNNNSSNNSATVTNKYGGMYTKNQEPSTSDKDNTTKKSFKYYRNCYSKKNHLPIFKTILLKENRII